MAVPTTRDELLAAIETNHAKLVEVLRAVPEGRAREPSLDGHASGTTMSICDLVAYLVGWNELVLKWLARDAAGEPIDFPETGFKWNELGRLAQKFYADHADLSLPQLVERLGTAEARIVAFVAAQDDAALYGRAWCGKWPMGRMIQFNTASPYDNARRRLRSRPKVSKGGR